MIERSGTPFRSVKYLQYPPIALSRRPHRPSSRSALSRNKSIRATLSDTAGTGGSSGGGGKQTKHTLSDDESDDRSGDPLGLLVLAVAGALTAYQIKDILEEPLWLEDTQLKSVSVIVPALNEESQIRDCVRSLRELDPPAHEILVVDGGSDDSTAKLAKQAGARVILAKRGRASQMNAGAEVAQGDLLCFMHADSRIPRNAVECMRKTARDKRVVLGGFRTVIKDGDRTMIFMTAHQLIKTFYIAALFRPLSFLRGARLLFGDQTLFCRTADFKRVGGYAARLPIMEDADLCIRLHMAGPGPSSHGQAAGIQTTKDKPQSRKHFFSSWTRRRGKVIMVLNPAAETSGRRLQAWGNPKATAVHFIIGVKWYMGATPEQMKDLYARMYTDAYR